MPLSRLWPFAGNKEEDAAPLYRAVVGQARRPEFFSVCGVPDSVDGRFEMIALHMFLVLHRLKSAGPEAAELGQALFDMMFADMDRSLREMGAGDLGVGRRVRAMAEGLYGRIDAYETGLMSDDTALAAALRRNLFGTVADPGPSAEAIKELCAYIRNAAQSLGDQSPARLRDGDVSFPASPSR